MRVMAEYAKHIKRKQL